jgi:hypothetical protein
VDGEQRVELSADRPEPEGMGRVARQAGTGLLLTAIWAFVLLELFIVSIVVTVERDSEKPLNYAVVVISIVGPVLAAFVCTVVAGVNLRLLWTYFPLLAIVFLMPLWMFPLTSASH